jgi:hypothetical protein
MARLDNRPVLYGEPRLSDAQVLCLRDAERASLRHVRAGWVSGSASAPAHGQGTVTALVKLHLLCVEPDRVSIRITQRGQERLGDIDRAAARVPAPDAGGAS